MQSPITDSEYRLITWQLCREPEGALGIAVRCKHGFPQVVLCSPVVRGNPFPTLFWLTCPYLKLRIDRLEQQGEVTRLSALIAGDPLLADQLRSDHEWYRQSRGDYFSIVYSGKDLPPVLNQTGIGGIRNHDQGFLKCLHLHAAMFLASGRGVAGKLIMNNFEQSCPSKQCARFTEQKKIC